MKIYAYTLAALSLCVSTLLHSAHEVNVIGFLDDAGSFSRHTSSFIDTLYGSVKLNFLQTKESSPDDLTQNCIDMLDASDDLTKKARLGFPILSGMSIYTDGVWRDWGRYLKIPLKNGMRLAVCVTERTVVPIEWIRQLNDSFDGIIVPDEWLVDVYRKSGLRIPCFFLPLALSLEGLLSRVPKQKDPTTFTFGFTGGFWERKNHALLMRAFVEEFGNDPHVKLRLHGRYGGSYDDIKKVYDQIATPNVSLEKGVFDRQQYEDFISSLDCFVTVASGEGFSIVPREALAAGVPCIVSDNTAQQTICKSGCVRAVPSTIRKQAYNLILHRYMGYDFNCDIKDIRAALRDVYQNYPKYRAKVVDGREWVKQYLPSNLKKKYLSLVAPKMVILGEADKITENYLMTSSKRFFDKYKRMALGSKIVFKETRSITERCAATYSLNKTPLAKISLKTS